LILVILLSNQGGGPGKKKQPIFSDDDTEVDEEDEEEEEADEDEGLIRMDDGDSEEEVEGDDDDDDDHEEEDEESLMDIEREAAALDRKRRREAEEAEEDLQESLRQSRHEGPVVGIEGEAARLPPGALKERIASTVEILSDFANRRKPKMSRQDYMDRLAEDLSEHYGYIPDLTELFLNMFSPAECIEFMEAGDQPRPMVIRVNTLKTRRKDLGEALIKRGVNLEPLASWSKVALKIIDSQVGEGMCRRCLPRRDKNSWLCGWP